MIKHLKDVLRFRLREWLGIYDAAVELDRLKDEARRTESRLAIRLAELDNLTRLDADVGFRGPCTVILSGVYRGRAYVQSYEMHHEEFIQMVERYRSMERGHLIRNVDAPRELKGAFQL